MSIIAIHLGGKPQDFRYAVKCFLLVSAVSLVSLPCFSGNSKDFICRTIDAPDDISDGTLDNTLEDVSEDDVPDGTLEDTLDDVSDLDNILDKI